jgi:hypothetical protein
MARKSGFSVNIKGVQEALRKAKGTRADLLKALDSETERAALRVVNEAREDAPRKDGHLKNSIDIYEESPLTRVVGSDRPYAQRQEYEHKTNRGFFRKALFRERTRFRAAITKLLRKVGE